MKRALFVALLMACLGVLAASAQEATFPAKQVLDANNMATRVSGDAFFLWDASINLDPNVAPRADVLYPKGTAGAVYSQGMLWGGIVYDGQDPKLRTGGSHYTSGLNPGRELQSGDSVAGADDPGDLARYHAWRDHRNWNNLDYSGVAVRRASDRI